MENQVKKPWYKKWWGILIIVVLVAAIFAPSEDTEASDTAESTSDTAESTSAEDTSAEDTKTESKQTEKVSLVVNDVSERELSTVESSLATDGDIVMDVAITITNNSVSDGLNMNPLYFTAETESMSGIETSLFITDENTPDSGVDIKEGISKDYVLTFEIPEGEAITSVTYDNMFLDVTADVE